MKKQKLIDIIKEELSIVLEKRKKKRKKAGTESSKESSLRDWLGAAEYLLVEGNKKVILCERGVSVPHTHRSTSRFLLDLQIIPAAQEVTHLPIITDPSHATFWRNWVRSMSLASVAAGTDGVMLEVHPDPINSAVDPLQPIDFNEFNSLVKEMNTISTGIYNRSIF